MVNNISYITTTWLYCLRDTYILCYIQCYVTCYILAAYYHITTNITEEKCHITLDIMIHQVVRNKIHIHT